jgi:hypothetical protein
MFSPTLAALEARHSPHNPTVALAVSTAIDANGGPLTDEQLHTVLLALDPKGTR